MPACRHHHVDELVSLIITRYFLKVILLLNLLLPANSNLLYYFSVTPHKISNCVLSLFSSLWMSGYNYMFTLYIYLDSNYHFYSFSTKLCDSDEQWLLSIFTSVIAVLTQWTMICSRYITQILGYSDALDYWHYVFPGWQKQIPCKNKLGIIYRDQTDGYGQAIMSE